MGLMTKMRDSMPVVFAVLAGIFLLMIVFEWGGQGYMFKSSFDGETIATVDGRKISTREYDQAVQTIAENQKAQAKKTDLTDEEMAKVQDQAYDELLTQAIIKNSMNKMGIRVTDQEVTDEIFYNPPPALRQQFTDSMGVYHEKEYFAAIRDKSHDSLVHAVLEEPARERLMYEKWQNAMAAGVLVTNTELKDRFDNEHRKATIEFVRLAPPPSSMRDYLSKVTDADMKKFYDDHIYQYKREEGRKMSFVVFQEGATARDSAQAIDKMETIKSRLSQAPENMVDSVAQELTVEYADGVAYHPGAVLTPKEWGSMPNADQVANAKAGETFILKTPQQTSVVRVLSVADTGGTFLHTRHILIGFGNPENKDSARTYAQNIYNQVKGGADFADLASKYSQDPGSALKGGDLGWAAPHQFVKQYEDAANAAAIGSIVPPVESQFGIHIIQVLGKSNRTLRVAMVPVSIKASSQTSRLMMQQAKVFREQAEKNGFEQAAKAAGYRVISDAPPAEKKGTPLLGIRQLNDWAFGASKGDISEPMRSTAYHVTVVAKLVDVIPAGARPFDEAKDQIRNIVAHQKMLDDYSSRVAQIRSTIGPGEDLSKLGQADTTLKPKTVSFGPAESVGELGGTEYAVNNAAFHMKPGEISGPIKGQSAYFIIKLLNVAQPTQQEMDQAKTSLLPQLMREKQQRFIQQWIMNVKEKADIVDYRSRLNIQ